MARQVNTFGHLLGTSGPVAPGAVEGWWASFGAADYGRSLWFEAHALGGRPGSKAFEVRAKRTNESGGNRSFTCDVVNVGAAPAMYALFVFWTDQV
jgi:hypothetical protein